MANRHVLITLQDDELSRYADRFIRQRQKTLVGDALDRYEKLDHDGRTAHNSEAKRAVARKTFSRFWRWCARNGCVIESWRLIEHDGTPRPRIEFTFVDSKTAALFKLFHG